MTMIVVTNWGETEDPSSKTRPVSKQGASGRGTGSGRSFGWRAAFLVGSKLALSYAARFGV